MSGVFDVPGWTVPVKPGVSNEKRKGRQQATMKKDQVQNATRNLEALINQLGSDPLATASSHKLPDGRKKKDRKRKRSSHPFPGNDDPAAITLRSKRPKVEPAAGVTKQQKKVDVPGRIAKKQANMRTQSRPSETQPSTSAPRRTNSDADGLSALQSKMKRKLDGARFRFVNELLYKSPSASAQKIMQDDPEAFSEYHEGFRAQASSWPSNPVHHYISLFSSSAYPLGTIIADLGCGDAALARALLPNSNSGPKVLSYDLISADPYVVEADICARLPLPGAEEEQDGSLDNGGQVVDVVVCSLSLMSTNWVGCIREAWRVLKPSGELKIAEVTSRIPDIKEFVNLVKAVGFKLVEKDTSNTHFILFDFQKISRSQRMGNAGWEEMMSMGSVLKPCEYKRR